MKLPELPKRRLEVTVRLIEEGLARIERLVSADAQDGILQCIENTLSAIERDFLREQTRRLRDKLKEFAQRFELREHRADVRRLLNAELSSAWLALENCRPKRMKGYGAEADPEVHAALEESLDQLLARVRSLQARMRS